jgi:hypothetical protein
VLLRKPLFSWTAPTAGCVKAAAFVIHFTPTDQVCHAPLWQYHRHTRAVRLTMKLNPKDLMKSAATRLDRHSGAYAPTGWWYSYLDMPCTSLPPADYGGGGWQRSIRSYTRVIVPPFFRIAWAFLSYRLVGDVLVSRD